MKKKLNITILLVIGIIIFLNLISRELFLRVDLTENGQYTLSNASKKILKQIKEPITIKAYFSEGLPPDIAKTEKDFKEILVEYENLSNRNIVYSFLNPNKDEEIEKEANQNGIQPVMINVREKDQVKQQKAYMGAIVELGEAKEIIPFIQPGGAMEYALSTAIKKLSVTDKATIGLLQGHGEPSIMEMSQVQASLSIMYNIEPITLSDSTKISDKIKTIAIVRPNDSIPASHFALLDQFLAKGGRLFMALNRVEADFQTGSGSPKNIGIETWLQNKGIQLEDNFVIDANCGSVSVQQQGFPFPVQMQFPYLPIATKFAKHPAVEGLEQVIFQFASTIKYSGGSNVTFTPLVFSSEKAGSEKAPLMFQIDKNWTEADFPSQGLVIAASFEGKLSGDQFSKIVLISDGDFPINGQPQQGQMQQLQPDNVNLMVNSIDWLSDDTGLIELRTKGITSRPLDEISDGKKLFLKILNVLLPILLVIIYGFLRFQWNRNKRIKRMQETY